EELAQERQAAREAIERLNLTPVMFELGARPHPPRELYRAYLEQSHVFVAIYWQSYGWVAPGEQVSDLELDNLRAALAWSLEADRGLGLRLAGALGYYWLIQSHFSEGRRWLRLLLGDRASLGRGPDVARALAVADSLAWRQGDAVEAQPLLEESVAMCRELDDDALAGFALVHLGLAVLAQGRHAEAHASFEEGLAHYRAADDAWGIAFSLVWLGTTTRTAGDHRRAMGLFEETLELGRRYENPTLALLYLAGAAGVVTLGSEDLPPEERVRARLRAARLFGAVDELFRELGVAMWQAFVSTSDELLAAARAGVDPEAWDVAFAEGRAMSLERAIEYASPSSPA